jgi:uncharacterized protein HemX
MGDNVNNNNNLIVLALGIVGIALGFFAYLVYVQNRDKQNQYPQLTQLSQPLNLEPQFLSLIQNQERIIENQQGQIDKILTLNTSIVNQSIPTIKNDIKVLDDNSKSEVKVFNNNRSVLKTMAGNVMNLKNTPQDKIRQTEFGLL